MGTRYESKTHSACTYALSDAWNGYDAAVHNPLVVTYVYAATARELRCGDHNLNSNGENTRTDLWPASVAPIQPPRGPAHQ